MRYLYALYAVLTFVVFFLLFFPLFLLLGTIFPKKHSYIWYSVRAWSYIWMFLIGMPIKIRFSKPLNEKENFIIVANHSSFLDTPMLFRTMPFPTLPLATIGFAKIPIFGYLYKKGAILVDRKSAESRKASVEKLVHALHEGKNIFIFPEGGINESENLLNKFYDGAFRLSVQTGKPILPVLFPDSRKRWTPGSFWTWKPGPCRTEFLAPILPHEKNIESLKEEVFEKMEKRLLELRA